MNLPDLNLETIGQTAKAMVSDRLHAGSTVCCTVSTGSMWPALAAGDRVRLRAASLDDLQPGDILVRTVEDRWIVHRLIERVGTGAATILVTKGDNALTPDPPWPAAQLVGVVVAVDRKSPKQDARTTETGYQARFIAWLSRGQSMLGRIRPAVCGRTAVKISRVCLRAAVRLGG